MPFADSASIASLAIRRMYRSSVFTLSAILLLGVGVGLGVPLFNLINIQLLQPAAAGRDYANIVINGDGGYTFAPHEIDELRSDPPDSFALLVGTGLQQTTAVADGVSLRLTIEGVVGPYFSEFGTVPLAGRLLTPDDERERSNVAVITDRLRRAAFTPTHDPVGASLVLGGQRVTVVGIVDDEYEGAPTGVASVRQRDAWVPGHLVAATRMFGRLRPGVSIEEADAELSTRSLPRHQNGSPRTLGVRQGVGPELADLRGRAYAQFAVLIFIGLAISLVASGSFSLLLFARVLSHQADISIRIALGATAVNMKRLLSVAAVVLATGATVVAVAVGVLLSSLFVQEIAVVSGQTLVPDLTPDWRLVAYTSVTTFGAAWIAVIRIGRHLQNLESVSALVATSAVGGSTQRTARRTSALVVAQTAVSTALLLVAAVFGRAAYDDSEWIADVDVDRSAVAWLDPSALPPEPDDSERIVRRAMDTARATPGVTEAAVVTMLPSGNRLSLRVAPEPPREADSNGRAVHSHFISVNALSWLGRRVTTGRMFTQEEERQNVPVGVVSATAAARLWPDADAMGQQFRFVGPQGKGTLFTVVGIVDDLSPSSRERTHFGELYVPLGFRPVGLPVGIVSVTDSGGTPLTDRLRNVFREHLPETGILHVRTMRDELTAQRTGETFWSRAYGTIGILVFIVALGGLYSLSAHLAVLRRREIAIRRALGATPLMLCGMLHREHRRMLVTGIGVGCLGGLLIAWLMANYFPTIRVWDPITIVAVAATLYLTGLAGALLPFVGAMRDPVVRLRDR